MSIKLYTAKQRCVSFAIKTECQIMMEGKGKCATTVECATDIRDQSDGRFFFF